MKTNPSIPSPRLNQDLCWVTIRLERWKSHIKTRRQQIQFLGIQALAFDARMKAAPPLTCWVTLYKSLNLSVPGLW